MATADEMAVNATAQLTDLAAAIQNQKLEYDQYCKDDKVPPSEVTYNYAILLIASPSKDQVIEGVDLLELLRGVMSDGGAVPKWYSRSKLLQRIVLAHLKLGQYVCAKDAVDEWLRYEPYNDMARLLHSLVLDRVSHDGLIGTAVLGLLGAGLLFGIFRAFK
mmetsp:Transcript_35793/g.57027  ORF Transcript_35793/g.57027 Transcript_35793/m.57027 type:complete len:162 (+) Transcript_35793:56-541(+)